MKLRLAPPELRCVYRRDKTIGSGIGTYRCMNCGVWTANLPLYKNGICGQKDRRKAHSNRRAA